MPAVLLDHLRPKLQFRRPALSRQSALVPFHRILDDYIRRIYVYHVEEYLTLIEQFAVQIAPYTKDKFPFNMQEELFKLRTVAKKIFDVVYDFTWEHIVSGYLPTDLFKDHRIQEILQDTIMNLPIKAWLEWTHQQLFTHIVQVSENLLPKRIMNGKKFLKDIRRLVCKFPDYLMENETLDDFLETVYKHIHYLPFKDVLYNEIHRHIYSQNDVEPDLYYTQIRQLVILPPSLVGCIREELRCQAELDTAEARRRKVKCARRRSTSRTHTSKRQSAESMSVRNARQALSNAEANTAKLVTWYEACEDVAKKRIIYQRTLIGTKNFLHKSRRRLLKLIGQEQYTPQQRTARRHLKEALGRQARRDPSRTLPYKDRRQAKQVSLFQFSLLEIIFAIISPFHIYHRDWNSRPEFVALTHHLHMLNMLPPLAVHIPVSETDFRYVRHVRGIPFTEFDTKTNQQKCMREANDYREAVCNLAISMNNPLYPREKILKAKHCYDSTMLARAKKNAAKSYRRVEMEANLRGQSASRKHRRSRGT